MPSQSATSFEAFNYFETLFANTKQNIIVLMNLEGIIQQVNDAFVNSFGYTRQDIIGAHFSILYTEDDRSKDVPQRELNTVLHQGQAYDNNYLVNKDKRITWVQGEAILIKSDIGNLSILKVIQNIHEQKESEASIKRLNDFNENILRSIDDMVLVLDENLKVVKANNAFSKIFKNEAGDAVIDFLALIQPYDVNGMLIQKIRRTIATAHDFINNQIEITTSAGEKKMYDFSCSNMPQTGTSVNVLLVAHDITMHKQAEREREDIIGFIAHELRNPLANIVLCNEMMGQLISANDVNLLNSFLQRSKNNVMRLNKMIAELYDATKVNAGNFVLEISTFNFMEMIKEAIDTIEILQPSYHIIANGDGDVAVQGDRYRLVQVVTNYLSNGIKYSDGNMEVVIDLKHDEKNITVSVQDKGMGIPKNQLPYIFERFFRAEKTKNLEGIGLGLYLCRQIIHAHHGAVWVESEEGQGSTFYFSIPLLQG